MIDCVLCYPVPTKDSPVKGPALSIFYPGAMLEKHGFNVEYFDERFDDFDKLLSLLRENPFSVGVSSMTGYQLIGAQKIMEMVKEISPQSRVIFGGAHSSILPRECVKENFVDFVIVGEGEQTMFELVKTLKNGGDFSKVNGICWKKDNKIIVNSLREFMNPLDWPFPLTQKNKSYFKAAADRGELMFPASRGCPYNCSFCYNQLFNRRRWRAMPSEKFKNELGRFVQEFSLKHIYINDDEVGFNEKRIKEIAETVHSFGLTWSTSVRCCDVNEKTAKIFEENGCQELLLGVESGSDRILNEIIKKGFPRGVKDVRNCAKALGKTNIRGRYNFMVGVPTESFKEIRQSIALADWIYKVHPKAIFNFDAYAPYPGTRLYQSALKAGLKEPKNFAQWSEMTLSNSLVPVAQNLYYICGLRFRGKKGDITSRNFPGLKRLLILPFEISARFRWKIRFFTYYALEKAAIKMFFFWASKKAV